jgi:3-hydroxyacyl-CoA dehydrogenase / enoyl-CoA hydratase / 3-hydroxybutyryl-CoA epimerase
LSKSFFFYSIHEEITINNMIRYEKDTHNIVTLTLEMEGSPYNIISHDIGKSFVSVLNHLKSEKKKGLLRGVIITSGKKNFLHGGDLEFYYNCTDPKEIFESSQNISHFFRELESPGVPVVAAINGTALGPGFGLALACHHRIVLDTPDIMLGLPETSLGLMPSGGEIIRLMWLLGIEKAYHITCDGHYYTPKEALVAGVIDELATDEKDLIAKAKTFLLENPDARRPWDTEGEQIPDGSVRDARTGATIRRLTAEQYLRTRHIFPSYEAILSTLVEGSRVNFDTACLIQSRYFTTVCLTKEAKNMTKAYWYDYMAIKHGANRPKGFGKFRPKKVGVVGAGLMGSGIAYACAKAGLSVVLKDISRSVAEKGKSYTAEKLRILVERKELTEEEAKATLNRIEATEKSEAFQGCDIIIEAVFENQQLKSKVIKESENYLDQYCIIASNTSSIPITKLGKTTSRPANFCGMRFFRFVEDEPLVEIVKGEATSEETIARAFDFIKMMRKVPIIVKDSWGFFSGRVRNTYILEGISLLQEGFSSALIENLGVQTGMKIGPLAWADDLSLDLIQEYERQAAELYGPKYVRHPAVSTLDMMVNSGRNGHDVRNGFYDYDRDGNRAELWKGLNQDVPTPQYDVHEVTERLLFVQILEALWCYQEGVIGSVEEANIGSLYGWGFPSVRGGVFQYINDYGAVSFVEKCHFYEKKHGQRFKMPKILRRLAESGELF